MPTLQLQFPVWVRYQSDAYSLSPLLFEGPEGSDARYEKALRKLRSQTIKRFRQEYKLTRENLPEALWYLFQPEYHFECLSLAFQYGNRFFNDKLSVAWFAHLGGTVVVLPAFDWHMFVLERDTLSRSELVEAVIRQVQHLARQHRKEEGEEMNLAAHAATKGEHSTTLQQAVFVQEEPVSFQSDLERFFFQFFRQDSHFEGRWEVQRVGHALNELYPDSLQRAFQREDLVEMLGQQLYNHENIPLVLLGPRKGGKTTILHETIHRYLAPQAEETLHERDHGWYLDPTRLIAGMSQVGAWQRRLESIIAFVRKPLDQPGKKRRDFLYFDNVMALFRVGKSAQNSMTLSDVLKPYLQKRKLQVVLETTPETWDTVSELDRSFTDLFRVLRVHDLSEADTLAVAAQLRARLEGEQGATFQNAALLRLLTLQRRYAREESLIGRVADAMHQLATKYRQRDITPELVQQAFNERTHFRADISQADVVLYEDDLRAHFQQRLIGQPQVVDALVQLVQQIKTHLQDPQRPYGSFLLIGPTGVGKTEAAKVLAQFLFTHSERLLRFDMNEYIDSGAVSRLLGDTFQPEGQLTSKVRHNPFCVLLFDEIEKAHPDVHNLLLQVLDEGRLTDAMGQVANFCNTVIIMTSNLGADRVGKTIAFQGSPQAADDAYEKAVRDFFRPEFINRIGRTLIFQPLTQPDIERIAYLQIERLFTRQGFIRRKVLLNVAQAVLRHLSGAGFDPSMGGRALKRQIEKELVGLLADELVQHPPGEALLVELDMAGTHIAVTTTPLHEAQSQPWTPPLPAQPKVADFEGLLALAQTQQEAAELACDQREEAYDGDLLTALREDGLLPSLFAIKEEVRDLVADLHEQVRQFGLRRNLVLRSGHFQIKTLRRKDARQQGDGDDDRSYLQDISNREQVEDYLSEVSEASQTLVQEGQSLYLHYHVKLARAAALLKTSREVGLEHGLLRIWPRLRGPNTSVAFLAWLGQKLGTGEDPLFHHPDGGWYLLLRGLGLQQWYGALQGFHLMQYYQAMQPHPVQVDYVPLTEAQWQTVMAHPVADKMLLSFDLKVQCWAELPQPVAALVQAPPPQVPHEVVCKWLVRFSRHSNLSRYAVANMNGFVQDLRRDWVINLPLSEGDLYLWWYSLQAASDEAQAS